MVRKIAAHKRIAVASVAVVMGAVVTAFALAFTGNTGPNLPEPYPPMTLTYEVYGASVSVGDQSIPSYKETRRLEYRSQTDWTETIIESPTLDLGRYGEGSDTGSYQTLKGNVLTEYDAMTGSTDSSTVGQGVLLPQGVFSYAYGPATHPYGSGIAGVAATTEARICFNGNCTDNTGGTRYTKGARDIVLLEGVGFTLPLKSGDHFILKSAEIQADRPQ